MEINKWPDLSFGFGSDKLEVEQLDDCITVRKKIDVIKFVDEEIIFFIPEESISFAGKKLKELEICCQKRLKGHVPSCTTLDGQDRNHEWAAEGAPPDSICADSVLMLKGGDRILLFGFLEVDRHLAHFELDSSGIRAVAEFNNCCFEPESEVWSQPVIMMAGNDPNQLLSDYAARVADFYQIALPDKPRYTVAGSWHYFGASVSEDILRRELAAVKRRRIPVDVYQIDDGWEISYGNWRANAKWPGGLESAVEIIREAGCIPGIWIAPFLTTPDAPAAVEHPDWLLREASGLPSSMKIGKQEFLIFDPSQPDMLQWLENEFKRLYEVGFRYFKVDFSSCLYTNNRVIPHDRRLNLLQLYRQGIAAVRKGIGDAAYLNICGGHEGGSIGLADAARTGRDTYGDWEKGQGAWVRIKQCVMRSWMSRWRHNDPDASVVRLNTVPWPGNDETGFLALGNLTLGEAKTMILNQFLGGGVVEIGENLCEISDERLELYRRVIPPVGIPAESIDFFHSSMPRFFRSRIGEWDIISIINCEDEPRVFEYPETVDREILIYDLSNMKPVGIYQTGDKVTLPPIAPHDSLVLKILPLAGDTPVLVATSLHFSGGGVEIKDLEIAHESIDGYLQSPWDCTAVIVGMFPSNGSWHFADIICRTNEKFKLKFSAD